MTELVPRLDGKQIYLRDVRLTDIDRGYLRWMNDPEINQYLESRFHVLTHQDLEAFVTKMQTDPDNAFFAIVVRDADKHIGNIKLGPINRMHRTADIGLVIGEKSYWGRGIATEAIQLVAEYGFGALNLHKLTAGCYSTNPGSARAFEKAGFSREGLRREQYESAGQYVDAILVGKVRPK
jgi:RimJ/RimL family protein N-acetyltransferase